MKTVLNPKPAAAFKNATLYKKLSFIRQISFGLYFTNAFFQRILRIDGDLKYNKHYTSRVVGSKLLTIENDSLLPRKSLAVSGGCYINACGGIFIGEGTIWSANVTIVSIGHDFSNFDLVPETRPIRIGRNCWLGAGAVVLPGIQLGDRTIVGANSVVTKSFEEGHVIIAGVPAREIKAV